MYFYKVVDCENKFHYMIIRDKNIGETLATRGYSKLPQMEPALLAKLQNLYSEYVVAEMKAGQTYWSMSDQNKELVRFLNKSVIDLLYPYIQLYFDEVKPIVSSFMVKPAHAPNVQFHQDWTFVDDEPNANSFTCWVPLVATNSENGNMGFLPGSHNRFTGYRASPSPPFGHIFPQDESLLNDVEYIEQLAGEPVVFNHRVIHGSLPNKTNNDRPALGFTFTSTHNKLVHMFLKPGANESVLTKYAVDEAFYDKYSNADLSDLFINGGKIPDYSIIEEVRIK